MNFVILIVLLLAICDVAIAIRLNRRIMSHESTGSQYTMLFAINVSIIIIAYIMQFTL